MGAEAAVDAAAEGEVPVDLPVEANIDIPELVRVDVGGPDQGNDLVAAAHRAPGDLRVARRDAGHSHDRGLPAQQLLDGWRDGFGLLHESLALFAVLGQVAEEAVEGCRHGVEAGDDQLEADIDDLVLGEAVAVDLGVEELADEVVAPDAGALDEELLEVLIDGVSRRLLVGVGLGVTEG